MSKESINPIALTYIFDEILFHFSDELIISSKNEDFIGSNSSNISIVSGQTLSKTDLGLLEKILKALSLSFDDVALIQNKETLNLPEFIESLNPNKIILFGINTFEVGLKEISLNTYDIHESEKFSLLQAEKFEFYSSDASKKKALWFALQKLFSK